MLAAGAGEALGTAIKAESARGAGAVAGVFANVFSYTLFGWALLAALAAGIAASFTSGAHSRPLLVVGDRYRRRDLVAGALVAVPFQLAAQYLVTRFASQTFKNQELSALFVVAVTAVTLMLAALLGLLGSRLAARVRERIAQPWLARLLALLPGGSLLGSVLVWFAIENSTGFSQLDRWLALSPLLLLIGGLVAFWLRLGQRSAGRVTSLATFGVLPLCLAVSVSMSLWEPMTPNTLAGHGSWSRYAITLGRTLSDFDGDGYSSWFSGGDCAPFDRAVGPGAAEVPEDGKDNNCIGGDARRVARAEHPVWHAKVPETVPRSPNLLVITIETFRHDHASFLGYRRDNTPRLREFAKDALRFGRMYASAPMTRLAVSSLFSSFAPSEIRWLPQPARKRMRKIHAATPWLPSTLQRSNYETLAVLTDFRAFTAAESAGFERGFDTYDVSTRLRYSGGTMHGFPAEEQVGKAIAHIDRVTTPFFLWLHLFEPHFVYEQPPGAPVYGADEQARYDAEIWETDRQIGRLLDHLRARGELDRTIVFVTGDHGEAFSEHDDRWHGSNLYDPQLRPAALLRVPGISGRKLDTAVTFTDIAPTLLNLLGVDEGFDRLRGRNLLPLILGSELESERFVVEGFSVDDGHAFMMAVVQMPYKLIYVEDGRKLELFDLLADPDEVRPLRRAFDDTTAELERYLFEYLESTAGRY